MVKDKNKDKVKFLMSIFLDIFPRAEVNYKKSGFSEFEKDLEILLNWLDTFESKSVPSGSVDNIWHSMILYTQRYGDFCQTHYGKFIHHIPCDDLSYCDGQESDCERTCWGPGDGK